MVAQPSTEQPPTEVVYPDSDGQPMADNTLQFRWIQVIYHNLAWIFAEDPDVFVAGDLLWYPVEGDNRIRQAPDVMVVFGVPKGDRGSYQQWKENDIAPQVAFEILSPGNTPSEMSRKLAFYQRYGVEEYYLYDPRSNEFDGWTLSRDRLLEPIDPDDWTSPRLGVRFQRADETLQLFRPDGQRFADYNDVQRRLEAAEQRAIAAERDRDREREKAERLAQRLREAGLDPDAL